MRRHILEAADPYALPAPIARPVGEGPAGWVWQTRQPLILSNVAEETRWPRFQEDMKERINSLCDLPLTTARRRLGALTFGSRHVAAYDTAGKKRRKEKVPKTF